MKVNKEGRRRRKPKTKIKTQTKEEGKGRTAKTRRKDTKRGINKGEGKMKTRHNQDRQGGWLEIKGDRWKGSR